MKLYVIIWSHRYGINAIPVFIPETMDPPDLTNAFMKTLGIENPEIEEDGGNEYAYWDGPFSQENIPILKRMGPMEWTPES